MCVLKCSVWSLKKASLGCDKLCWWPLNFSTLHNYTCIKIGKFIDPKSAWDITELLVHPASRDMGGAPPHTDNRIRQAARGQGQVRLLKTTRESQMALLNMAWLLALDSRGSWLEHLLNISGAALVTLLVLLRSLPARAITRTLTSTPTKPTI